MGGITASKNYGNFSKKYLKEEVIKITLFLIVLLYPDEDLVQIHQKILEMQGHVDFRCAMQVVYEVPGVLKK